VPGEAQDNRSRRRDIYSEASDEKKKKKDASRSLK
jgi:hypothetical protein